MCKYDKCELCDEGVVKMCISCCTVESLDKDYWV